MEYITQTVQLCWAMTTSAYYIQSLSDVNWIDNIQTSSKLAQIASIRHYRASCMYKKFFMEMHSSTILLDLENKNSIDSNFLENTILENDENISLSLINSCIEDKSSEAEKIRKSYSEMLQYTNYYIRYLLNIRLNDIKDFSYSEYLDTLLCLQCGEIYHNQEDFFDECNFCHAGLNHIVSFSEII